MMMTTEDATTTQTTSSMIQAVAVAECCCWLLPLLLLAAAAVAAVVVESGRICEYIFFGRETRLKSFYGFTRTQHSDATTTTAIFVRCQQLNVKQKTAVYLEVKFQW